MGRKDKMSKISDYVRLHKQQLQLEVKAIKLMLTHAGAKGTEAEKILTKLLRKYLPKRYAFGSGFVAEADTLSPQTDIIVYDEMLNTPIYQGESNGVYTLGSVYACIEVTAGELTRQKLKEDIEKLAKLRSLAQGDEVKFKKIVKVPHPSGKGNIVKVEDFKSPPPPRTYICALWGSSYKTAADLAAEIENLTRKFGTHMHGVLVIDSEENQQNEKDWLVWTEAYQDYRTTFVTNDSLYVLLQQMNAAFLGMYVGQYPGD